MMKRVFQRIAGEENAEYHFKDDKYLGMDFSIAPVTRHYLQLTYKGHTIELYYELGNHDLGRISCEFPAGCEFPYFQIVVRSHWRRLFNKSLDILHVDCGEQNFQTFLQEELTALGLERIARRHLFEPKMHVKKGSQEHRVVTEFHLAFSDKHNVIQPLLRLYEALIDYALLHTQESYL